MHRVLRRVLVVDDNPDDRVLCAELLRHDARVRYDFEFADGVETALSSLVASSIDLIIADWGLLDGSALDIVRRLRQSGNLTPLLVITGGNVLRRFEDALRGGAVDFLSKDSLTAAELSRAVEHSLVRGSLERELARARELAAAAIERERSARHAAEVALADGARSRALLSQLQVVAGALGSAITVEDVSRTFIEHAAVFAHAQAGSLYVCAGEELVMNGYFGFAPADMAPWQRIPLQARTPITEAARRAEQVVIASQPDFVRLYPGLSAPSPASWVVTPILADRAVIGTIGLKYPRDHAIDSEGLAFLAMVADALSQALSRARYVRDLSDSTERERRLLAVIGHDLRTPLSAIGTGCTLLRQDFPDNPLVLRLERSAARMSGIIGDLMSRSEVRARTEEHARTNLAPLDAVVADQVEELRAAFPDRLILFEAADDTGLEVNEPRVSQILANLVRNALQHGAEGAPVSVTLRREAHGAVLAVRNTGAAIPADVLAHIFKPFRRGPLAAGSGGGLGLFIVRECADACGATVHVLSNSDATEFSVHFSEERQSGKSTLFPPTSS
jgi:signal transduction histidine kinase/DNA-binding response OmpR family regulator